MGSILSRVNQIVDVLNAVSGYQKLSNERAGSLGATIDSPSVEAIREAQGGNIAPLPITVTRWYMSDLETAQYAADTGDLGPAGRLVNALRRDGTVQGVLGRSPAG